MDSGKKGEEPFQFGNCSDTGLKRKVNEDYFGSFATPNGFLFLICDGMGGHAGGQKASRIAVEAIQIFLQENSFSDPREAIRNALLFANEKILEEARGDVHLSGMGSTCVLLLIKDGLVFYGHAGDSRLYRISQNAISRLTRDHSFVQNLVNIGEISAEEAESHPRKNEITNALGLARMRPDVCAEPVQPVADDYFLLCTDGLTGMVGDESIKKVIGDDRLSLQEKSEKLVAMANDAGGVDNITVQLVHFDPAGSFHQKAPRGKRPGRRVLLVGLLFLAAGGGLGYFFANQQQSLKARPNVARQPVAPDSPKRKAKPVAGPDSAAASAKKMDSLAKMLQPPPEHRPEPPAGSGKKHPAQKQQQVDSLLKPQKKAGIPRVI